MRGRCLLYILDGHTPVPCDDPIEWASWSGSHQPDKIVAKTDIAPNLLVSTVFLGVDHGWSGRAVLFETAIFGGPDGVDITRYATWDEALSGHNAIVSRLKSTLPLDDNPNPGT